MRNLTEIALQHACQAHAGRIAAEADGMGITYAEMLARSEDVAAQLRAARVGASDTVMVKCSNHPTDFAAFLGVWRAGAAVVPVHRSSPTDVIASIQTKAHCRGSVDLGGSGELYQAQPPLRHTEAGDVQARQALLHDAALVIFTSGSTGHPKGAVLSHGAFHRKLLQNQRLFQASPETVTLLVLSDTFSFGIWVALMTLVQGGRVVMQPRFRPASFVEALASQGITFVAVVPSMIRATFATLTPTELDAARGRIVHGARLKSAVIGGEPLGMDLSARLRAFLAPAALYDVYGLTETATSDFVLEPSDYPGHESSIGRPFPGISYRVVDHRGEECPAGVPGELQLKTPYLMAGYLGDEELTRQAFSEGWFRTGDLATFGEDGFVNIVGRLKELIFRGSHKITPLEVERALQKCSAIAEAMVTGLPDPILGQRIHALVVPQAGMEVDVVRLRSELSMTLEKYKWPDVFYVGTSLPTGRTGKMDRSQLQKWLTAGALQAVKV